MCRARRRQVVFRVVHRFSRNGCRSVGVALVVTDVESKSYVYFYT